MRLGRVRLAAMKNILSKISGPGLARWQEHLVWIGVWKYNALQDQVAACESLWPDSLAPEDRRPNAMQDMAREVGAKVSEQILDSSQRLARAPPLYNEPLTHQQHEMMLTKGFEVYEADSLHLANLRRS